MTDLYPSATPAAPTGTAATIGMTEKPAAVAVVPARASTAALLYPTATAPVATRAVVPVVTTEAPIGGALTTPQAGGDVVANAMYGDSAALPNARYGEAAAQPGSLVFAVPDGWDASAAGQAERAVVADAMASMGAPASVAHALWGDVVAATAHPITTSPDACMAQLRATWGNRTDRLLDVARSAFADMAAKYPGAGEYMIRTGLGNSAPFIMRVVAAVGRRR